MLHAPVRAPPNVELVDAADDRIEQVRAFCGVGDRRGHRRQICADAVNEMEGEVRMCTQIRVPAARSGQAREIDDSVDVVDQISMRLGRFERAPIVVMSTV